MIVTSGMGSNLIVTQGYGRIQYIFIAVGDKLSLKQTTPALNIQKVDELKLIQTTLVKQVKIC